MTMDTAAADMLAVRPCCKLADLLIATVVIKRAARTSLGQC